MSMIYLSIFKRPLVTCQFKEIFNVVSVICFLRSQIARTFWRCHVHEVKDIHLATHPSQQKRKKNIGESINNETEGSDTVFKFSLTLYETTVDRCVFFRSDQEAGVSCTSPPEAIPPALGQRVEPHVDSESHNNPLAKVVYDKKCSCSNALMMPPVSQIYQL